jgi:hypothetical protein
MLSTSLTIKEIQIKTTIRLHLTSTTMTVIKTQTTNVGEDVEKKERSYTVAGM